MLGKRVTSGSSGYTPNSTINCQPCPPCALLFPAIYRILPSAFNNDTTAERYTIPDHATDDNTPPPTTPKRPATPPTRPRSRTLAL